MKSTFGGGGKHGHYGYFQKPATYLIEAGEPWTFPNTGGIYPTFVAGINDADKNREVTKFVLTENNIKKAEVMQELLKNQFLEAGPEDD